MNLWDILEILKKNGWVDSFAYQPMLASDERALPCGEFPRGILKDKAEVKAILQNILGCIEGGAPDPLMPWFLERLSSFPSFKESL